MVNSQSCPECNEHLSVDELRRPRVLTNYLSKLKIKCDYAQRGCPELIRVENLKTHVANCVFAPVLCSNENCGFEISNEACKSKRVKCSGCGYMQEVTGKLERSLLEINSFSDKVYDLEGNVTQGQLEVVKKEVKCVKSNIAKVNRDMAELKDVVGQMMGKLNELERMAQKSDADQKQILGERLYHLIYPSHPNLAGKITGMLLELEYAEIVYLLDFHDALAARVEEAVRLLYPAEVRKSKK